MIYLQRAAAMQIQLGSCGNYSMDGGLGEAAADKDFERNVSF